jgi:hypothetical protein
MDFSWIIWFLVVVVFVSIAFAIVKYLIMPVVPPGAQAAVWAILGIIMLIALLYFASNALPGHHSLIAH